MGSINQHQVAYQLDKFGKMVFVPTSLDKQYTKTDLVVTPKLEAITSTPHQNINHVEELKKFNAERR